MNESQLSPLFTVTEGQGQPLFVLHGWGMNHRVWQPVREQLAEHYRVTWVDLPGHGLSAGQHMGSLETIVTELEPLLSPDTIIMGWSLGGLIAQGLAKAVPERVKALTMVASTPRFTQNGQWPHGLADDVLTMFAENLQKDYQATVKRFFALQFMGTRSDPAALKALQKDVLSNPADAAALEQGLEILATADFRNNMPEHPVLWLLGRLDKLIPVSLADELERKSQQYTGQQNNLSRTTILPGAAHVPFVTHPELFLEHIHLFIKELV